LIPRLRGLLVFLYGIVGMALVFFASLPVMLLTGSGDLPMWVARRAWAPLGLWLAGVRLEVHRAGPLPSGPAIFACNHESALDIWGVVAAIPRSVRFVAKRELFDSPVLGWYLALGEHVKVDRRDHAQAVASLAAAAEQVRAGTSLVVFAEGTRSRDGRIHPFKKGPFVIAAAAGVPVVPVAVAGAGHIIPRASLEVYPGTLYVGIGAPVIPAEHPGRDDLLREVRRRIIEMHLAMGGRGGDPEDAVAAPGFEGTSEPGAEA
jgi:1-acyl-sn-glycerol-3-phosphate acyltransferase